MIRAAVTTRTLDPAALAREVARPDDGAVAQFVGIVRRQNGGRAVVGIEYTAYVAMAERELVAILEEARSAEPGIQLVVEHRTGTLAVGEASVVVTAAHPHRRPALDAVAFVIEQLKRRVPIWKCEHYADGTREWVHAGTGAPAAEAVS